MLGMPSKSATVVAFCRRRRDRAGGRRVHRSRSAASRKAAITGSFSIALVALIAGGAVAGLNGEREIEEHHDHRRSSPSENECGAEETEADENASQIVGRASRTSPPRSIFDGSAPQSPSSPGVDDSYDTLTLPRSQPEQHHVPQRDGRRTARLVIEMHPARSMHDGRRVGPERLCTALVDEGGAQLLTVVVRTARAIAVEGRLRVHGAGHRRLARGGRAVSRSGYPDPESTDKSR